LAVYASLLNILADTLHIGRPSLNPQPEDAQFCGARHSFNVVMVTKDAPCCGTRDPLNVISVTEDIPCCGARVPVNMIMAPEDNFKSVFNFTLMYV
jgi:hypothetical protein